MEYLSALIKMADASSSGKEIEENPIETAISRGASLSEPAKASISRKRKIIVNDKKYKASREHNFLEQLLSTILVLEHFSCIFWAFLGTFLAFWEHNLERPSALLIGIQNMNAQDVSVDY